MAKNDEVTFLATKGMLQGETGFTTVTAFCTINRTELSEERSVLLMVEGRTDSQAPVCSPLLMVRLHPSGRLFKMTSSFS
jgi:hypothetical protein